MYIYKGLIHQSLKDELDLDNHLLKLNSTSETIKDFIQNPVENNGDPLQNVIFLISLFISYLSGKSD